MADELDRPIGIAQWVQIMLKMTASTAMIVIAGFLVYRMAGGLDVYANKMDAVIAEMSKRAGEHTEMTAQYRASERQGRQMLSVLIQMCLQGAKTRQDRQDCVSLNVTPSLP